MSNRFFRIPGGAALCSIVLTGVSWGQDFLNSPVDETAATPQPPFVQTLDPIAYTIAFTHTLAWPVAKSPEEKARLEAMKKENPQIKSLMVEKAGDIRHDIRQWDDDSGTQKDVWYWQTIAILEGKDGQGIPNGLHANRALSDKINPFPELSWVGKKNFIGVIQLGPKKTIDVYRINFQDASGGFDPIMFNDEEVTAYIDDATRLPLALKTHRFFITYSFRAAPESLTMPAEYQKIVEAYKERLSRPHLIP